MEKHRIYTIPFSSVYPLYVQKAERKGRSREEVDAIIRWLTGYDAEQLAGRLQAQVDFETFFSQAPRPHPERLRIKGRICGVRVEEIADPLMRDIRCLDKLVDELARGKALDSILRR